MPRSNGGIDDLLKEAKKAMEKFGGSSQNASQPKRAAKPKPYAKHPGAKNRQGGNASLASDAAKARANKRKAAAAAKRRKAAAPAPKRMKKVVRKPSAKKR